MTGFTELHVNTRLIDLLREQGIISPTAIQQQAIPVLCDNQDAILVSETGSGKTLAYALPAIQRIDIASKQLQVLILAPTRELSMQILEVLLSLTKGLGIRSQALIGGATIARQVDKLKLHPHIVIGTPGRINEILKIKKITCSHLKLMIIDEVDQIFALSAANDIQSILTAKLKSSQMVLVSATVPSQMDEMIAKWMKSPVRIQADSSLRSPVASSISHTYTICEQRDKIDTLRKIVRMIEPRSAIVFVNEIEHLAEISAKMKYVGLSIEAISGEASKQERATILRRFREQQFQLLVATDILARGLDIPEVTHVIQLDPAIDANHYLHRVGRTGRMGRAGTSICIITRKEQFILEKFEKTLGIRIHEKQISYGTWSEAQPKTIQNNSRQRTAPSKDALRTQSQLDYTKKNKQNKQNKQNMHNKQNPQLVASKTTGSMISTGTTQQTQTSPTKAKVKAKSKVSAAERKNKGAPKWLKAKAEHPQN